MQPVLGQLDLLLEVSVDFHFALSQAPKTK
jgi:hypothetical protein